MIVIARFHRDPRCFALVFPPDVHDGHKIEMALRWAERGTWVRSVVIGPFGEPYEAYVDVSKAYALEPDANGPDPLEGLG